MKRYILVLIPFLYAMAVSGQNAKIKKMVVDDSSPIYKADTSIVIISDSAFRKIVSVNYKFISEDILKAEFIAKSESVKQQLASEKEQRQRSNQEIEKLKAELETEKSFYKAAAKELKFAAKKSEDIEAETKHKNEATETRKRQIEIVDNPRREGS